MRLASNKLSSDLVTQLKKLQSKAELLYEQGAGPNWPDAHLLEIHDRAVSICDSIAKRLKIGKALIRAAA